LIYSILTQKLFKPSFNFFKLYIVLAQRLEVPHT